MYVKAKRSNESYNNIRELLLCDSITKITKLLCSFTSSYGVGNIIDEFIFLQKLRL